MLVGKDSSPFGSQSRTRVLMALVRLGESYPRELARLLKTSLFGVQRGLHSLERDGLVAARIRGRTRLYRINPRYFARADLERYLLRLADADRGIDEALASLRRRPRAMGKPL
jgi:DNA-binding transcriptional ArsR family regulator